MTVQEPIEKRIERIVRAWPQWSPAEQKRMDAIVAEVLEHCRERTGNQFIRDWCNRVLVPQLRPFFVEVM